MKKIVVIYDDFQKPNREIRTITGNKSYGDTIFKRITLKNRMKEAILKEKAVCQILDYKREEDRDVIFQELRMQENNVTVLHLYSNYALQSTEDFLVLLTKACYINRNYVAKCGEKPAMAFLCGVEEYKNHFDALVERNFDEEEIANEAFMDLSELNHFLTFITSGFDARFFNALLGDEYTVTKKSTKIEKIKAEYQFYHLLPEGMKMWFVQPYDYKEGKDFASYTMERFHTTDIAIRFVHGAVSTEELRDILDKLFYFIGIRAEKKVSSQEAKEVARDLYVEKLKQRMADLKKLPQYEQFDHMISMGTDYKNLEEITDRYLKLFEKLSPYGKEGNAKNSQKNDSLVVGHGDLCFSNILYNKEASLLKLIDPKGALKEEELYTDRYYDLAKLSHSICGCYDFFNSGLYQISVDGQLKCKLSIDTDAAPFVEIFKEYLEKNGYDYRLVRLYEASLFLSMLPYHMDQPGKVFGFILNAVNILDEVEKCTKI